MVNILIIYSFIALIFLFNSILVIKEFFSQLISFKKHKYSNVYWFDLLISTLIFFILSISIILNSLSITSKNYIIKLLYGELLIYFPLFISNNFSLNIINTFLILINRKIVKNKLYCLSFHILKHFILIVIDAFFILFLIKFFDINSISLLINLAQLFLFFIHIITILFLSKFYKNILYNNKKKKKTILIKALQHLFLKSICDVILNLTSVLKCFNKKIFQNILDEYQNNNIDTMIHELYFHIYYFSNAFFACMYFCIFTVILIGINSEFNISVNRLMSYLFCRKIYNSYSKKTIKNDMEFPELIINSKFSTITNKTKNPFFLKSNFASLFPENDLDDYEYTPCNFFIIIKLLYLYYQKNKSSYLNLEKENDSYNEKYNKIVTLNSPNRNNVQRKSQFSNSISDFMKRKIEFKRIYSTDNLNKKDNDINNDNINIFNNYNIKYSVRKESENYNNISKASNINISIYKDSSSTDIKEKINTYSRTTLSNVKNQNPYIKYSIDEVMKNIEDIEMKNFFMNKLLFKLIRANNNENNDFSMSNNTINTIKEKDEWMYDSINNISNITIENKNKLVLEFTIESLTNNYLFDLFPFYDIKIKDIIKSLDISDNMDLFSKYSEKKKNNSSFSLFNTKDSLLSFEIYDKNFMHKDELINFIKEYKKYLIEKISNFSYSFLPLIIGIFNIKYLSYNKIIILYRNPLSFSNNINYHFWSNICFTIDKLKQIETSTKNNEVVDINEIEINNNIILEENEYKDTVDILENDLLFLQNNLEFNFDFNLNLFIVNDTHKNIFFSENQSYISNEPFNNNQKGLDSIIQESYISNLGNDFNNNKLFDYSKRYYGSEDLSSLEKLYVNNLNTNRYIFKIYFKDIFNRKIIENEKEKNVGAINGGFKNININDSYESEEDNQIKIYNKRFCERIKTKLIRNIGNAAMDESLEEI